MKKQEYKKIGWTRLVGKIAQNTNFSLISYIYNNDNTCLVGEARPKHLHYHKRQKNNNLQKFKKVEAYEQGNLPL